jgi:hypothetical protein
MTKLSDEQTIKLKKSHFTFSLIPFEYENPDSIDFISWRKMIDENNKFIISNTPIYKVNNHPQIQYSPGFAPSYNNFVRKKEEKKLREEMFVYRPPVVEKEKLMIPELIRQQCILIFETQKMLREQTIPPQITHTPI